MKNRETVRDVVVFLLLVMIGTCGRWGQPQWCFTPIAAVTIFAGYYFSRWSVAILVPLACLAISDQTLSPYDHWGVMLTTYAAMTIPVVLGRMLRSGRGTGIASAVRWTICGLVPATVFWLATNFAVWALLSYYEKSAAGLAQCYWAALPFYRWMLAGDMFYLAVVVGCYALARGCVPAPSQSVPY